MKKGLLIVPAIALAYSSFSGLCYIIANEGLYNGIREFIRALFNNVWSALIYLWFFAGLVCILILLFSKTRSDASKPQKAKRIKETSRDAVSAPKDAQALEKIKEIAELHKMGELTDDEFQQKKAELLSKM